MEGLGRRDVEKPQLCARPMQGFLEGLHVGKATPSLQPTVGSPSLSTPDVLIH